MRLLLIDTDYWTYSCGFSAEHKIYHVFVKGQEDGGAIRTFSSKKELKEFIGDSEEYYYETELEVEELGNAIHSLKTTLKGIMKTLGSTNYRLYLTGEDNFRNDIATIRGYKSNRDNLHKPTHYKALRKYLIDRWGAIVVNGQEADDMISEVANSMDINDYVVVSIDKDLDQIKGAHYNPNKHKEYWVTEEEGLKFLYTQILTGDSVDAIVGIPNVGPKKAEKILEGCDTEEEMYLACKKAYEDSEYEDPDAALLENARLVYLLKEEGVMWEPPRVN